MSSDKVGAVQPDPDDYVTHPQFSRSYIQATPINSRILGDYTLLRSLETTDFSCIYEASHPLYGNSVIKVPHRKKETWMTAEESLELSRLTVLDEASIIQSLQGHKGIIPLLGYDIDGEVPYLALQYIPPPGFEKFIPRDKKRFVDPYTALSLTAKLLETVVYMHEHGCIHRDIKPENILVTLDDGAYQTVIIDFNNSRQNRDASTLGRNKGFSVKYCAPEQIDRHERIDERADLYPIAKMLNEMLTGIVLSAKDSGSHAIRFYHTLSLESGFPLISKYVPQLESYQHLLMKSLAFEREDRHESAQAFLQDVESVMAQFPLGELGIPDSISTLDLILSDVSDNQQPSEDVTDMWAKMVQPGRMTLAPETASEGGLKQLEDRVDERTWAYVPA